MAAHIGVTELFGVTQPSATTLNKTTRTTTIETFKTPAATGEISLYTAGRTKTIQVVFSGFGTAPLSGVTAASGVTPGTQKMISAQQDENNKQGAPPFTATYSASEAFADADSEEVAPSAAPDLSTIEIVSVSYSLTESLTISTSVQDRVISDKAGEPGFRGTFGKESTFSLTGWGDIPVSLGTGGAGVARLTGGKLIVDNIEESENAQDCNQWRASGGHCPSAS
jgi:hypothetical protein